MSLRRLRAMAVKELLHVVRDVRSLILALALPLLLLLLFGYALTLDVDRVPAVILDADRTPQSRALIARFEGSRFFEVLGMASDYAEIERSIDSGRCLLGLVIPAGLARDLLQGREAEVQLLLDGSDSNTAGIALGYAEAALASFTYEIRLEAQNRRMGRQVEPPIEARPRVLYNSGLESKNYIVPGLIAVILMIIAALLTSLTIAREWENGTMEQLLSTPVRPGELVLGKMTAYFLIGAIDTLLAVCAGVFIFDVPLRGPVWLLAVSSGVFLCGALFWGILLSALARSQLLAYQMGVVTSFLPAFLLSGFIFAIENMPAPIQAVTHIVPARYFITISKDVFLKGAGLEAALAELALLAAFAGIVYLAATRRLRRKLA